MRTPSLEKVIAETLKVIENNKAHLYDISENARSERNRVNDELLEIQQQILQTIEYADNLGRLEKDTRIRLMEVSRNYERYTEEDVRSAYEKDGELQVELGSLSERERQLRLRRSDLERGLLELTGTVDKAEGLMTQVSVVLDYLGGNLIKINNELEVVNQRRLLAPRIIHAQEEERKRVAREIHDGPAQSMTNVVLRTEVCEKLMDIDLIAARKELRDLRETVKNSLQDVRRIIFDLRPMALDDLGLVPALSRYLENIKERYNIAIEMKTSGRQKRLEPICEVAVYRVIQEAVMNTIKHAAASKILVKIDFAPTSMIALVKDDGVGFEAEKYLTNPRPDSYGLLGMRERLEILGGTLAVKSTLAMGTEILIILPLD